MPIKNAPPRIGYFSSCLLFALIPVFSPGTSSASEVEYIGRIGLFSGPEFTSSGNAQFSEVDALTASGFISGTSDRFDGSFDTGQATWVASAATGVTTRVGLFSGDEFTGFDGSQISKVLSLTESGFLRGSSDRFDGMEDTGQAAWLANAATGVTARVGLFIGDEFTSSTDFKFSYVSSLSESGYASGSSDRYNGTSEYSGQATWVADASTGVTTRVGLFSEEEFTSSENAQYSFTSAMTEAGYVSGSSIRFDGAAYAGEAAWIANAATGITTRVGFFSAEEFTSAAGSQASFISPITESGYASGYSYRYDGEDQIGQAAWVTDASAGTTTCIGLFLDPEFTSSNGTQYSEVILFTESGYAGGASERYNGGDYTGQAAWVAEAATGTTTRIGLFSEEEFTRSDDTQYSEITRLTESGYAGGLSLRFNGTENAGQAAWIANAATGLTSRVGLFTDPEFTSSSNTQSSFVSFLTESGFTGGSSTRYNGSEEDGKAAWVARISTGATTRVGLFSGSEFTSSTNTQSSTLSFLTESGFASGSSTRFNGSDEAGQAAWVANAATGTTTRVGLTDSTHTRSEDYQSSTVTLLTEAGLAVGYSNRYDGSTQVGQTAWIFDLTSDTQIAFDLSVRSSDGYAYSEINGITSDGLAYGYFTLFDEETNLGNRAFVWSMEGGTSVLDEAISGGVGQYGWNYLDSITAANADGFLVGTGSATGFSGEALFVAQAAAVPEPSTGILLALMALGAIVFFRLCRKIFQN